MCVSADRQLLSHWEMSSISELQASISYAIGNSLKIGLNEVDWSASLLDFSIGI